eukprot:PhF_6_TR14900/c0_g1_i3/m.23252
METSTLEERLGRHDDILRAHRERFEAHKKWLQTQRSTPSFQSAALMDSPLEPMPASPPRRGIVGHLVPQPNTTPVRGAPNVYEDLIEKGKMYQLKKEKLREEAVQKELKHLKKIPQVSLMAKQMKRDDKIEERFKKLEFERRQMVEFKRNDNIKTLEQEQKHAFQPKISKKGKRATSRTNHSDGNTVWQQKREEHLENLRTKKIIQEMAEVRGAPEIDEKSIRLAERKKEKEGLNGYNHLDVMLERDRLAKLAAWEKQQAEIRATQPGNPRITAFAAMTPREGDVYDRLYTSSFETEAKRSAMLHSQLSTDGVNCTHSPRITANASSIYRDRPVEEDLLQRHEQAKAAQEEQVRYMLERERDLHTPAINPVSDEIAARLPETSRERLFKPKTQYYDPTEYPFQPVLNQNSIDIDAAKSTTPTPGSARAMSADSARRNRERIDLLYQREQHRQDRLDLLRREEEQKLMSECTFQPVTHNDSRNGAPLRVYNRVSQWARRRDQKLKEQQYEKDRQELKECSFRPNGIGNSPKPVSESSLYGGDGRAWGVEEYVDRQREARKRQMDKASKGWVTGDNWKNQVTVPVEFNLGRKEKPIKSLQKPLEAPIHPPSVGAGYYGANEYYAYDDQGSRGASFLSQGGLPPQGAFSERTSSGVIDR